MLSHLTLPRRSAQECWWCATYCTTHPASVCRRLCEGSSRRSAFRAWHRLDLFRRPDLAYLQVIRRSEDRETWQRNPARRPRHEAGRGGSQEASRKPSDISDACTTRNIDEAAISLFPFHFRKV